MEVKIRQEITEEQDEDMTQDLALQNCVIGQVSHLDRGLFWFVIGNLENEFNARRRAKGGEN